mgnify:FL=1
MSKHITQAQRYYISQRLSTHDSVNNIALDLNIHRSNIYRELKRNSDEYGRYYFGTAQLQSELRRTKASTKKQFSKFTTPVKDYIISHLKEDWSPEQISGRMKIDIEQSISHQTIYDFVWNDKASGGNLYKKLPHQGKKYKYGSTKQSKIKNRIDISKRPQIVETKQRIGDFEGDTIVGVRGGGKNCLLTLVDRKSKFTLIRKTLDKSAMAIQTAMLDVYDETTVPFKTITYDNGTEFSNHQEISAAIGCNIYFARPYRSCERGLNEHTNGQIRRYFPKKTDFSKISEEEVARVQNALNNRPRRSLGFLTPNEVMTKHLNRVYKQQPKSVAFQA